MLTDKEILGGLLRRKATLTNELEKVNLAISVFSGNDTILDQSANNEMTGALEYDPASTIKEKIFFALDKLKKATAEEIFNYLTLIEGEVDEDALFKSITLNASRLYRAGNLAAAKKGRRFIYSLPKSVQGNLLSDLDKI